MSKRFGPFSILDLVGKNEVKIELPDNIILHPVAHVSHTRKFNEEQADIYQPVQSRPAPIPNDDGAELLKVDCIIERSAEVFSG